MISSARRVGYKILCDILVDGSYSDNSLNSAVANQLEPRDRNLTIEIVYGTLRRMSQLDYYLEQSCSRGWESVDDRLKILLRMGVYQLWHTERVPDYAVVNDAVSLARSFVGRGASTFVNANLRRLARERPWATPDAMSHCPAWIQASLPRWLWQRWADRFGVSVAMEYAISLNSLPRIAFRLAGGHDNPIHKIKGFEISPLVPGAFLSDGSRDVQDTCEKEHIRIQDEASQLIPQLLGSIEGWKVWDACAAPGGKSAILQGKCTKKGVVISSDLHWHRALFLRQALASEGCKASGVIVADASSSPPFRCMFDAVIADAPCSGLGTLRRNPEIKWRFTPNRFPSLADTQYNILNSVSKAVRAGGMLLYSTCGTEPEENEDVIERFLLEHKEFHVVKPEAPQGIQAWLDGKGFLRTFPGAVPWDGFFGALMVRNTWT